MAEPLPVARGQEEEPALRAEIVRLNKIIQALMDRAERSTSARGSDFSLFQTAIVLEQQVHRRTEDLEAALRENEKVNRALQQAKAQLELEIQQRKRAESLREGQLRVLEMIALDAPLNDTLDSLLRCIEAQCEGMLCSVLLLAEDGEYVRSSIAPSLPPAYLERLHGMHIAQQVCPCSSAMHRREPVFVTDIQEDPVWADCRPIAASYDLRACWSMPIFAGAGNVLGAFAMYYRQVRRPGIDELQLLELAVRIAGIAIERKRHEAYIRHMAHHDALTGLPNRILLEDRLRQAIAQAHRHDTRVAVMFLDLDHFKNINDTLGHHIGDRLLQAVAKRMLQCVRAGDSVARLGGDEFVVCLSAVAHNRDAAGIAQKIQEELAQCFTIDGHALQIGSSIGISLYPLDGTEAETLMKAADVAMYDAKAKGRGNFQFFTSELNVAARQRLEVSNQLRQALPRGELVVYYQPQVSMRSGAIIGAEALLRWRHPELRLLSPARFIPILEEIGLMDEIGKWVLHTACAQNLAWQAQGLPPIRVAVNLSARQFSGGDIVAAVAEVLRETGMDPEWLDLEITESLILDNSEPVIKAMHDLKAIGVTLSLDDFGTGYSSLSYLRRFPIDRLKIDRSFVHDIAWDAGAADIVRSIIALSQKLGLGVVAEGVETDVQLGYLQKQGCPEFQGFLFSPALPEAEMTELLRADRRLPKGPRTRAAAHTLLVVDDDQEVCAALKRLLRKEGLNVLTALNSDEAFGVLAKNNVGVILSDLCMPGKSGIEFLSETKRLHPNAIRLLLTGHAEIGSVVNAINQGAIYKFLTKPWEDRVLIENIREAFVLYSSLRQRAGAGRRL